MARLSFSEAFAPGIKGAANILSEGILNNAELERKRKEEEKQQGILQQLIYGNKVPTFKNTPTPFINAGQSFGNQQVPLSPQEQFSAYSQLNPANQNAYEYWQKQNAPKEVKPHTNINYSGENILGFNPNTDKIESLGKNPNYEPDIPKSAFIKDEVIGDKIRALKGYEDPNADTKDPNVRVVNGKKYKITDYTMHDIWEKKTSSGGEDYFDFSKDTKKVLGDYYKEQQKLKAITNAGFGNVAPKENEKPFREQLDQHNRIYLEAVRNVMKDSAKRWYDGLYNAGGGNIDPRDYLLNLKDSFANGELGTDPTKGDNYDVADFNGLLEQFKAIYGFDPREKYGQFLEAIQ